MKICFVVKRLDFFISHRLDLAINLAKTNSVSVITNTANQSKKQINRIRSHEITIHHLEERVGSVNIFSYLKYALSLRRLVHKLKPDFVYYVTLEISFFGALISNLIDVKKSFFLISGLGPFFFNPKFKYRLARKIQKIIFLLSQFKKNYLFIFQNVEDLNIFINLGFVKKYQAVLIPGNGIDTKYFSYHERGLEDKITFLFASRLIQSKGINEFLVAANSLAKKYNTAKFLIAGKFDSSDPDSISEEIFKGLAENNKITYLGELPHEEMKKCFGEASVFVLPSYGEGLPKVSLEAASTGLPIITTDVRGCRDCVKVEYNGVLVKPKDAQSLEDAMESFILVDPLKLSEYGKNSSELIKSKYELKLITNAYLKLQDY